MQRSAGFDIDRDPPAGGRGHGPSLLRREPAAALRPFIAELWAHDGRLTVAHGQPTAHEVLLPSGRMHITVRLSDEALCIADPKTPFADVAIRGAMVAGARSSFYIRKMAAPSCSVGAVLHPGAAPLLFGCGAGELAGRHTPLDDLLGAPAQHLRECLLQVTAAAERLRILEAFLAARLPWATGIDPAVARLLELVRTQPDVSSAVRESGSSHRHFIARFRHHVGLAPKTYRRLLRFGHALAALRGAPVLSMADLAATSGYADQSHCNREFLALAGMTPQRYLRRCPQQMHHVPIAAP